MIQLSLSPKISKELPNFQTTNSQIKPKQEKDAEEASKWFPASIDTLFNAVIKYGTNWRRISRKAFQEKKTADACQAAYRHLARENAEVASKWSPQDIDLLDNAIKKYGPKWHTISQNEFKQQKTANDCQAVYRHLYAKPKQVKAERKKQTEKKRKRKAQLEPKIETPTALPRPLQPLAPIKQEPKGLLKYYSVDFENTELVPLAPQSGSNEDFKLTDEHYKLLEGWKNDLGYAIENQIIATIKENGLKKETLVNLSREIKSRNFVEVFIIYVLRTVHPDGDNKYSWSAEETALLVIAAEKYAHNWPFISCKCFKGQRSPGRCAAKYYEIHKKSREKSLIEQFKPESLREVNKPPVEENENSRERKRQRLINPLYHTPSTPQPTSPIYNPDPSVVQNALLDLPPFILGTASSESNVNSPNLSVEQLQTFKVPFEDTNNDL